MFGREQFSDWKAGDDLESMKRDVPSAEELMAADTNVLGAEERERVLASFTATSLSEVQREADEAD